MVTVRAATLEDSKSIWQWRNDAATRVASVDTEPVAWPDHEAWFSASLAEPSRTVLVAVNEDGERVGMVRFDHGADATATVSINLNPAFRGKGLGRLALREAIEWLDGAWTHTAVIALVRTENLASRSLFEGEGFAFESEANGFVRLVRDMGSDRS